jgi:hypothetical protein
MFTTTTSFKSLYWLIERWQDFAKDKTNELAERKVAVALIAFLQAPRRQEIKKFTLRYKRVITGAATKWSWDNKFTRLFNATCTFYELEVQIKRQKEMALRWRSLLYAWINYTTTDEVKIFLRGKIGAFLTTASKVSLDKGLVNLIHEHSSLLYTATRAGSWRQRFNNIWQQTLSFVADYEDLTIDATFLAIVETGDAPAARTLF